VLISKQFRRLGPLLYENGSPGDVDDNSTDPGEFHAAAPESLPNSLDRFGITAMHHDARTLKGEALRRLLSHRTSVAAHR
jgi:hypothetical protein